MGAVLEGIKVLDMTTYLMAPVTGALLGEYGAEVIKIEDPAGGDPIRDFLSAGSFAKTDINFGLELGNRNKKSLALNLKDPRGREVAYKLVERSDIFLTNIRHPALEKLGMDYETLSRINPRLIYAHGTGYGPKGPDRDRPAYDELAFWARGGTMGILGQPNTPPVPLHGGIGDMSSGAIFVAGIMAALLYRERTGEGQKVDCSLYHCGIWAAGLDVQTGLATREDVPRMSRKNTGNPIYNTYQAKDGKWFQFVMLQTDRWWDDVCKVIGREDLITDPRFNTHEKRCSNSQAAIAILDEVFATKPRDEWAQLFNEYRFAWAPQSYTTEIISDPQALANNYFTEVEHPSGKRVRFVAAPWQLSKTPIRIKSAAPALGQHTEETLLDLGYTQEQIQELRSQRVIL